MQQLTMTITANVKVGADRNMGWLAIGKALPLATRAPEDVCYTHAHCQGTYTSSSRSICVVTHLHEVTRALAPSVTGHIELKRRHNA